MRYGKNKHDEEHERRMKSEKHEKEMPMAKEMPDRFAALRNAARKVKPRGKEEDSPAVEKAKRGAAERFGKKR